MARIVRKRKSVEPPKTPLAALMEKHLDDLRLKNYSEYTIKGRRVHIGFFLDWAFERGITEPVEVTRTILERYQKHVFDYRKSNGEPLGFNGQHDRIVPLRVWFKWMARHHQGWFKPKKPDHYSPRFIGGFTQASQDHEHYENGKRLGDVLRTEAETDT